MALVKSAIGKALFAAAGYSLSDELRKKDAEIQKLETALRGSHEEAGAAWDALGRRVRAKVGRVVVENPTGRPRSYEVTLKDGGLLDAGDELELSWPIDPKAVGGPRFLLWTGTADRVPRELRPSLSDRGLIEIYAVGQ